MVICAVGLGGLLLMWSPGSPKPILDSGSPLPGSVSEKIWVDINGVKQGMVIRGRDVHNPVLLWVHGGSRYAGLPPDRTVPNEPGGPLHRGVVGSAWNRAVL